MLCHTSLPPKFYSICLWFYCCEPVSPCWRADFHFLLHHRDNQKPKVNLAHLNNNSFKVLQCFFIWNLLLFLLLFYSTFATDRFVKRKYLQNNKTRVNGILFYHQSPTKTCAAHSWRSGKRSEASGCFGFVNQYLTPSEVHTPFNANEECTQARWESWGTGIIKGFLIRRLQRV